jgi:hypothetical protein
VPESLALIAILVAAAATVVASTISAVFAYRVSQRQMQAQEREAERTREEEAERLVRKYRDPLARAAFDLQSRLYNIASNRFLEDYLIHGNPAEQEYARESTLYVIAEFFGWVEIQRREIQFLDLRDVGQTRQLSEAIDALSVLFLTKLPDTTLRVFRNEQRAIGEVMMVGKAAGAARECIGYAAFVERRRDPDFARWFAKLEGDVERLGREPGAHLARLARIQHALIDFIDFLDPDFKYFSRRRRQKIQIPGDAPEPRPA